MTYRDPRRGIDKRVLVQDGQLLGARLIGETAACDWLKDSMAAGLDAAQVRQWVLAPLAAPPPGGVGRGRVVCNCMDVAEWEIRQALAAGADLEALQDQLRCGIRCGSCVPELRRVVADAMPPGALAVG